ncbi:putative transmembrane protein [Thioalkalivibrio nitratireducens DSM 14787]|uniref:Transmembrane protein n=1 Tax=Thioalkalivibrio nitratireducens (strain DSM 14787 / UNIQEM 213 / ALEN2) TaxID=1255043 RepID=L0DTE6_THIND|nr:putative transmembrane protein [Thioalkalivibrio nitratireducens DSM 14787]
MLAADDLRAALNRTARERDLRTSTGRPVRFVAAADAGAGRNARPYESHIAETGRVPTRDDLHDVFNALVWLTFPLTKAALNAVQAQVIAREGVRGRRGPVRDAATLIDESGLLLAAADPRVFGALAAHDWPRLLVRERARWGPAILPMAFGHALFEKLVHPFKAITAVVVPLPLAVPGEGADTRTLDAAAAGFVRDPLLAPRRLLRLPVLGIPGWHESNADAGFYDDAAVFRPAPNR